MLSSRLTNLNKLCRHEPLRIGSICIQAISVRCISSSSMLAVHHKQKIKDRWSKKTERFLTKMSATVSSGGGSKTSRRKKWHDSGAGAASAMLDAMSASLPGESVHKVSEGSVRRAKQLSVIFYQYITSIMNSGEICPELVVLNFEIQRVKITTDFNLINVYWMASGTDADSHIQSLLDAAAGKLRLALIGLHIIGAVPPIKFVKDLTTARLQEVERLLSKADMGPDFEPTTLGRNMRTEPRLDHHLLTVQSRLAVIAERFSQQTLVDFGETRDGPNGSLEIVGAGYKQGVAWDGEKLSDVHLNDFGRASTDFQKHLQESDGIAYDVSPRDEAVEEFIANGGDTSESSDVSLRDDLYDIAHTKLMLQVLNAKRKSRDRSYDMSAGASELDKAFDDSDVEKLLSFQQSRQKDDGRVKKRFAYNKNDGDDSRLADKYEDIYEVDECEDFIDDDYLDDHSGRK